MRPVLIRIERTQTRLFPSNFRLLRIAIGGGPIFHMRGARQGAKQWERLLNFMR
jgi:hypothetical protein